MKEWLFFLFGFSSLFFLDSAKRRMSPRDFLEIFIHSIFLVAALSAVRIVIPIQYHEEITGPFLLIAGYWISQERKKSQAFFLNVFGFSLFAIQHGANSFSLYLVLCASLALAAAALQIFFTGLKAKLRFSPVPEKAAGLPISLVLISFLALIFTGLRMLP